MSLENNNVSFFNQHCVCRWQRQSIFCFVFVLLVIFLVESCFHIHNALYFPLQALYQNPHATGIMVYKKHTQTIGWVYEYYNVTKSIVNHTHPGGDLELVDGTNTNQQCPRHASSERHREWFFLEGGGGGGGGGGGRYWLVQLGLQYSNG